MVLPLSSAKRPDLPRIDDRDVEHVVWSDIVVQLDSSKKGPRMIKQLLARRVASNSMVARFGQLVFFGGACLIPVLVFRKFAELELSEAQLLIGVLVTMSMALLCTALGVLLESKTKAG